MNLPSGVNQEIAVNHWASWILPDGGWVGWATAWVEQKAKGAHLAAEGAGWCSQGQVCPQPSTEPPWPVPARPETPSVPATMVPLPPATMKGEGQFRTSILSQTPAPLSVMLRSRNDHHLFPCVQTQHPRMSRISPLFRGTTEEKGACADWLCAAVVTARIAVPAAKGVLTGAHLVPLPPVPCSPSLSRAPAPGLPAMRGLQAGGCGWGMAQGPAVGEPWQGGTAEGLTHTVQQTPEVRQPRGERKGIRPSSRSRDNTRGRGWCSATCTEEKDSPQTTVPARILFPQQLLTTSQVRQTMQPPLPWQNHSLTQSGFSQDGTRSKQHCQSPLPATANSHSSEKL